jgi:hypothetical protein
MGFMQLTYTPLSETSFGAPRNQLQLVQSWCYITSFTYTEEYNLKHFTHEPKKTVILTPKIFSDHQPQELEAETILQL